MSLDLNDTSRRYHCIVVTHTYERLRRTLLGVMGQTIPPVSITVAADSDDPRIEDTIAQAFSETDQRVRLVWRSRCETSRRAQNRNNGVRSLDASTLRPEDILIFLDGDCIPAPTAFAAHLRTLEHGDVSLGYAIRLSEVQTATLTDAHVSQGQIANLLDASQERTATVCDRRTRKRIILRHLRLTKPHKPGILSGNFAVRYSLFQQVNGFDESFTGWGAEDDDIARRLYAIGAKPRSSMKRSIVYHQYHPSEAQPSWSCNPNTSRLSQHFQSWAEHGLTNPCPQPPIRIRTIEPKQM